MSGEGLKRIFHALAAGSSGSAAAEAIPSSELSACSSSASISFARVMSTSPEPRLVIMSRMQSTEVSSRSTPSRVTWRSP